MLNIGIIGTGRAAGIHARAIQELPNVLLRSVCGRTIQDTQRFADQYKVAATNSIFSNFSEMLEDPKLDAVIIATPDPLHADHVSLAVKAGKAILVEKPLCTSIQQIEFLSKNYTQSKKTLAVGYHLRLHRGLQKIAEKIHRKELGEIHHLRLHWAVDYQNHGKWRLDPENQSWFCLTVLGTHLLDVVRWFLVPVCGEIVEIKSLIKNLPNSHADGTVLTMFRFESGAIAEFYCSVLFNAPFSIEIHASREKVIGQDLLGEFVNRKIWVGDKPLSFEQANCYVDQLNDFCTVVTEKREPRVSFLEGLKNVSTLIEISN